ncbi:hypothetical protein [Corynebacterium cystitidis]|uniref:hypothetical protein n=1 Tax=Corynebacterium cystitidis TaxID=35757 RepID=UPI00211EA3AF|nr:hypothetical protein [Corynebacterium cystitidis]
MPRSQKGTYSGQKFPLDKTDVPAPHELGAVCRQASITIQNTEEHGAKFLQHGPSYKSPEWAKLYGRRSIIEGVNARLKTSRGQNLGDQTGRMMRGWAAQFLACVFTSVAYNVAAVAVSSWRIGPVSHPDPTPPNNPFDGKRRNGSEVAQPNALPMAA